MTKEQCPVCAEVLEVREVAPCWDCGHDPEELAHLRAGKHTYAEFEVFGGRLVLCDFCRVDFSSYDPATFGLPPGTTVGLGTRDFRELRTLEPPAVEKDKVCPSCRRRLKFLNWLDAAREHHRRR